VPSFSPLRMGRVVQLIEYTKSGVCRTLAQRVVLPVPEGAETTNKIPDRVKLFKVRRLFPELFQL